MVTADFSGFGFAVGSVFGHRTWLVDAGGNLRGVTFKKPPWTPGVNEAVCQQYSCTCPACLMFGLAVGVERKPDGAPGDGEHLALHRCGFYAYFKYERNEYTPWRYMPVAHGIIEGFGETVLGPRGFRAQRARIRALHLPPVDEDARSFTGLMLGAYQDTDLQLHEDYPGYGPRFQRCRNKYADVPFYDDIDTMLREHPPSDPPEPE